MAKKKPLPKPTARKQGALAQRLLRLWRADGILRPGLRVGVAVSGGADSVALLRLLLELREQLGVVLSVVHFNHKLRGKASDVDERFVAKLAAQHRIPFLSASENIAAKAKRERGNLEETARRSRYAFFEHLVAENKLDKIAVAHTADDQAETVLGHILRGTGLAGLGGIHPQAGCVFRPLLKIRRAELRAYLRSQQQPWREDATNRDTTRTRARIRHKLLPLLEKRFQPAVVEHLCQLAELARRDEAYLESQAEKLERDLVQRSHDELRVPLKEIFTPENTAMQTRLVRRIVERLKLHPGQLSTPHVEAVLRLADLGENGKWLPLPGGVEVRREREYLTFRPASTGATRGTAPEAYAYPLDLSCPDVTLRLVELSCALRFTVIDWPLQRRETKVSGAILDRDRLQAPLVVRSWQPGDAARLLGHQKGHKLSRLLNEAGVSRWEKVSWPVLASGGKIAWVRGLPVAAEFAAGDETHKGVVITEVPLT